MWNTSTNKSYFIIVPYIPSHDVPGSSQHGRAGLVFIVTGTHTYNPTVAIVFLFVKFIFSVMSGIPQTIYTLVLTGRHWGRRSLTAVFVSCLSFPPRVTFQLVPRSNLIWGPPWLDDSMAWYQIREGTAVFQVGTYKSLINELKIVVSIVENIFLCCQIPEECQPSCYHD